MADAWRVRPDWLLSSAAGTSCGPVERFKGVRAHSRQGQVHRRGFHQMRHTFASGTHQRRFFPEGIAFDGNRFNRTGATAPLFDDLAPSESADEKLVSRIFASWNHLDGWLRQVEGLRRVA